MEAQTTLYEMNQQLIAQLPEINMKVAEKNFRRWYSNFNHNDTYFMLLNNDLHYYTLFANTIVHDEDAVDNFWAELLDVLSYCGTIKVMEEDTNGAFAIWVIWEETGVPEQFYLFPYDRGVVNF